MSQPDPGAKWDEVVPTGWAEGVERWEWRDWIGQGARIGWRKWGPCPRCGHTMSVYQRALRAIDPARSVEARCNCRYEHEGRPSSLADGCGPGSGPVKVAIPSARSL
jgi:hypothetical protein